MMNEILHERFWLKYLKDIAAVEPLPGYQHEDAIDGHLSYIVPTETLLQIEKITGKSPVGRYCFFITAIGILLQKYTGGKDAVIATAAINAADNNVLFLRSSRDEALTVKDFLSAWKDDLSAVYQHQQYPYLSVTDKIDDHIHLFRYGFIDTAVQTMHDALEQCELLISFSDTTLSFSYTGKYPASLITQFATHLLYILEQLPQQLNVAVKDMQWFAPQEETFAVTPVSFLDIAQVFRNTAARMGNATAIRHRQETMSYAVLDKRSDQYAAWLSQKAGAGDVVAICMSSSFDLMISIIAVLKIGAIVLPLVPSEASERNDHILSDSSAKILLTEDMLIPEIEGIPPSITINADTPAWLLYTSGSTGKPKGVCITHGNLFNMLYWFHDYFGFSATDVFPQKTTVSFTDSLPELLLPLTFGANTVYLRDNDHVTSDAAALMTWLKSIGTTIIQFVPSVFDLLSSTEDFNKLESLRTLILSGEEVKRNYQYRFDIYNLYGCSEGTASSTIYKLSGNKKNANIIGKPIYNTQIYIRDKYLRPVPRGVCGDIYLGGDSVAVGYWKNEQLTAERFINGHMYKTGDRGRWLDSGDLEYLGREDGQLKLHGVRIETGEIEMALLSHPAVSETFVTLSGNSSEAFLAAYIVADKDVSAGELRNYLSARLPLYFIPAAFVLMATLPRTSSAKISKKNLPDAWKNRMPENTAYIAPRNQTEAQLIQIWQELLQLETPLSVHDHFLTLGGHSLKAIRLMSQVEKAFNVKLSFAEFFRQPTVENMAMLISKAAHTVWNVIPRLDKAEHYALSNAQQRMWILNQLESMQISYNLPHSYLFKGQLDIPAFMKAFASLIQRHESLRTIFAIVDGEVRQRVLEYDEELFKMDYQDLSGVAEATIQEKIDHDVKIPFDLCKGPLIRTSLYKYNTDDYAFAVTLHHIITDGWSMQMLVKDILALYNAYTAGKENPLPELKIQYKDYAAWQNNLLTDNTWQASQHYWTNKLSGTIPVLDLPVDKPRKMQRAYDGAMYRFMIESTAMQEYCNSNNVTMFIYLNALLKILLFRYSGQPDIIIGTPIAGRNHESLEDQIGLYLNNLVLRDIIDETQPFLDFLQQVKKTILDAFDHQFYPYDKIITDLSIVAPAGRNPLYDVMVVMAATDAVEETADATFLQVRGLETAHIISKLDLTFFFVLNTELHIGIEYRTDLFESNTIERIAQDFTRLVNLLNTAALPTIADIRKMLMTKTEEQEHDQFSNSVIQSVDETF